MIIPPEQPGVINNNGSLAAISSSKIAQNLSQEQLENYVNELYKAKKEREDQYIQKYWSEQYLSKPPISPCSTNTIK